MVWYLVMFGLVLRERNHGAVPSRSNHGGHFWSPMTTAMTWWQQLFQLHSVFRQWSSLPIRTFPFPAFAQQLRHPTNARVASWYDKRASFTTQESERCCHLYPPRLVGGEEPEWEKKNKVEIMFPLINFELKGSPRNDRWFRIWREEPFRCWRDATRALVGWPSC